MTVQPPDAEWQRIAETIREEIARRRISRQGLADQARISISTLEKALAGKRSFTLATLIRLEAALGMALRPTAATSASATVVAPSGAGGLAPDDLGSYARQAVTWLEGRYLTLRPGFGNAAAVYSYITTIAWDDATSRLVFAESERQDGKYAQQGVVAMPYLSSHIYLVTNDRGQFRTLTLGRPSHDRVLHGILNTLFVGDGTQLAPMACPVVLRWLDAAEAPALGVILPDQPEYAERRALLNQTVSGGFARFNL